MNIVIAKLVSGREADERFQKVSVACEMLARESKIPLTTVVLQDITAPLPPDTDLVILLVGEDRTLAPKGSFTEEVNAFENEGGLVAKGDFWNAEVIQRFKTYLRYVRKELRTVAA